jgi:hypothetical protein
MGCNRDHFKFSLIPDLYGVRGIPDLYGRRGSHPWKSKTLFKRFDLFL